MNLLRKIRRYLLLLVSCSIVSSFSACEVVDFNFMQPQIETVLNGVDTSLTPVEAELADKVSDLNIKDLAIDDKEAEEVIEEIEEQEETLLPEDMTDFDMENQYNYCTTPVCNIDKDGNSIICRFEFEDKVPRSDNDIIYLFELQSYENDSIINNSVIDGTKPIEFVKKSRKVSITVPYEKKRLFSRFLPAILIEGEFIPIAKAQFITNPEILAKELGKYPKLKSKKGILLDANTINKKELYDLEVQRIIYNMPLSYVIGESDSEALPTTEYEYDGETYLYNTYMLAGFDSLFKCLTDNGYHITLIILNDWNEEYQEIMHPLSRRKTGRSLYYAFNTEEEDGTKLIEATASFLADRYTGGDCGMVYDWVIANEINQQGIWNYMKTGDLNYYTESFERSFRIFYNAIKSNYSEAKVYFSIDHDWNNNGGNNYSHFNGRDLLYEFNEIAKGRGNYDWGLSIHPYPNPLNRTKFWTREYDKTEDAKVITPMNLSALTDVITKNEFLDTKGKVRNIGITELGFCSRRGEDAQAAAFAYCYYIIDDNKYIDSFLLNRQHDDDGALESGLSLGIYNNDYSPKKIEEVFKYIDTEKGKSYIPEMLDIIGVDSFEEALEKAR